MKKLIKTLMSELGGTEEEIKLYLQSTKKRGKLSESNSKNPKAK